MLLRLITLLTSGYTLTHSHIIYISLRTRRLRIKSSSGGRAPGGGGQGGGAKLVGRARGPLGLVRWARPAGAGGARKGPPEGPSVSGGACEAGPVGAASERPSLHPQHRTDQREAHEADHGHRGRRAMRDGRRVGHLVAVLGPQVNVSHFHLLGHSVRDWALWIREGGFPPSVRPSAKGWRSSCRPFPCGWS